MYCGKTLIFHQNSSLLITTCHMFRYKLCAIIRSNCNLRSSVPCSEADISSTRHLKSLSVYYHCRRIPSLVPPLSQKNTCSLFKFHCNIILPSMSMFSRRSVIFIFSHKTPICSISLLPHNGKCPVRLILLHSTALIISC